MPTTITSIDVPDGTVDGGTEVTLTGTGFAAGASVTFGGKRATDVQVTPPNQIVCRTPPRNLVGKVTVTVTNRDGTTAPKPDLFEYTAVVTKITPDAGPNAGGTRLTITGKGFVAGMVVEIGGAPATNVVRVSETELQCTTPAGAGNHPDVDIWNPGKTTGSRSRGFAYCAPTVTGVLPREVPVAGGTDVTIRGRYFVAGATVTIGTAPATNVVVKSSAEITARTPAQAEGPTDVVVTAGGASGTLTGGVTYVGAAVTSLDPKVGPVAGGTAVTIRGLRFKGGADVQFGGTAANAVHVVDATTITATTPALAAGAHNVTVQNVGEAQLSLGPEFTAIGHAKVSAVAPPRGPVGGGRTVTITGNDFAKGATVRIGGHAAADVVVASATTITAKTPAHAAGAVDVEVRNPGGDAATLAGAFTYSNLQSIEPSRGPVAGGTAVVIRGSGFAEGATVTLGGQAAENVERRSATEIAATTPAHAAATVDVEVKSGDTTLTIANGFTYSSVTSVEPQFGPLAGGTVVTLRGGPFAEGTAVAFGASAAAALNRVSDQQLDATTPVGADVGPVDIIVTHEANEARVAGGFTYRGEAVIDAVDPSDGPVAGGTRITITGDHFVDGASVTVDGQAATDVRVVSPTTITATTAAGPPLGMGPRAYSDVSVTNPASAAAVGAGLFLYRDPPEVVTVSPARGPVAGGRWLTLTGTNFVEGAKVFLGGAELAKVEFIDTEHLTAQAPPHSPGKVSVAVQNPGEVRGPTCVDAYEYVTTPADTGDNEVVFLLDGEEYFAEFRAQMEAVRQAPRDPLTYVRLAFWMIEADVTIGDITCFESPAHRLLVYIDQVVRAGHDVDIIAWQAPKYERKFNGMADDVAKANEAFAAAIRELDEAAAASGPDVGRARMYLEHYEGDWAGAANHQKIAIFSVAGQRTAMVGGLNLSNHYFAPSDHGIGVGHAMTWHDTAVRLRGPATDDVEAEWMRRWKRTAQVASNWVWNAFGGGGEVFARGFAYWSSNTVKLASVSIQENKTRQAPHPDDRTVSIALTRSEGSTRYRYIRDKVIELIDGANDYVFFENYHFADPDLLQAVYRRHEARRLAGHELAVAIVVPMQGGASAYMGRRAWLHMVLRFKKVNGTPYCRTVWYLDDAGIEQSISRAACAAWEVVDTYDTDNPEPKVYRWLDYDCLKFKRNPTDPYTTVYLDKITKVDGDLHFYSCYTANLQNVYNHSKVAIFDDQHLVCGTSNWSFRSMQYDGEIAAFVDSGTVAQAAVTALLHHYNPGRALAPNNLEIETLRNLSHLAAHNVTRDGGAYTLLQLNHHQAPALWFPREKPAMSESPSFTWF